MAPRCRDGPCSSRRRQPGSEDRPPSFQVGHVVGVGGIGDLESLVQVDGMDQKVGEQRWPIGEDPWATAGPRARAPKRQAVRVAGKAAAREGSPSLRHACCAKPWTEASANRTEQWPGVPKALTDALSCPAGKLFRLVDQPVGVAGVLAGAIPAHGGQLPGFLCLVLVDEEGGNLSRPRRGLEGALCHHGAALGRGHPSALDVDLNWGRMGGYETPLRRVGNDQPGSSRGKREAIATTRPASTTSCACTEVMTIAGEPSPLFASPNAGPGIGLGSRTQVPR